MKELVRLRKGRADYIHLHYLCVLMTGILMMSLLPAIALGAWQTEIVDIPPIGSEEYVEEFLGQYSSIAVDSNDVVHISYFDSITGVSPPEGRLKYASGFRGSWVPVTIDSAGFVGEYSSIAVDSADKAHISYYDRTTDRLKYANNISGWTTSTVGTTSGGEYTSIEVGSDDSLHISHIQSSTVLKYTDSSTNPGGNVDTSTDVTGFNSIALDPDGMPHISYYDANNAILKYAMYLGPTSGWVALPVDNPTDADVGQYSSIAIDSSGNIHISYYDATNADLKYAVYDQIETIWMIETLDSTGDVGKFSSIAIDSNDDIHISYYDETNGALKYLKFTDPLDDGDWTSETVDSGDGDIGQYSSIAVDSNDNVHISYFEFHGANGTSAFGALKYATNAPAGPCTYAIAPDSLSFGKTGGTGSINVTTQAGCAWTATSNNPDWITVTAGASGSGSGTVAYSVAANTDGSRNGTISVAGYWHYVEQSSSSCAYAINIEEFYIPASGGTGYKFAVTAEDGCAWTLNNSNPDWILIDEGSSSGVGNGTVVFSVAENMGSGERSGSLGIEGEALTVTQRDNTFTAALAQTGSWVQITFDNETGDDILTIRPSCYRTYFFMSDALGKIVPHRDFITAVAIPDDVVTIPVGEFTLNCDLTRMFAPEIFSLFTPPFTLMATYANYLADTAGDESCTDNPPCYDLWTGAIPSGTITLDETQIPFSSPLPAGVSFFPSLWNADWATSGSETITAVINGLTGTPDPSKIFLNGTVGIIPGSYSANSPITVAFNAAEAVQSLGSIGMPVEGDSVRVYPRVSVQTDEGFFTAQNGVEVYTSAALVENALTIDAVKHTVATGTHPATSKEPIQNMAIRIYDKSPGSCAANMGISWKHYPSIWGSGDNVGCLYIAQEMTDGNGRAVFDLPEGDFLAIGKFIDGTQTLYPGVSVGLIVPGSPVYKQLQIIVNAKNEKVPGKYRKFTGSELLVIEPEYVEWDGTEELYPFVFDSIGDWAVTTAVSPPEGFVADQPALSEDVNSSVEAVQFTITDIGSKWVPTDVEFTIKHKNKKIKMKDKIGVKLTEKLAKEKGISIYGEEDDPEDKPKDKKKDK